MTKCGKVQGGEYFCKALYVSRKIGNVMYKCDRSSNFSCSSYIILCVKNMELDKLLPGAIT